MATTLPATLTTAESMTRLSLMLEYPRQEIVEMLTSQYGLDAEAASQMVEDQAEPLWQ